jgi:hypothetical protein
MFILTLSKHVRFYPHFPKILRIPNSYRFQLHFCRLFSLFFLSSYPPKLWLLSWRGRDLAKLYEILESARNPSRLLMAKLEEMEDGQFVAGRHNYGLWYL